MSTILKYLSGSDDPESLTRAVDELARSRNLRQLEAALGDSLPCEACQSRLAEYAQAVDMGAGLTAELQAVARHLAHCDDCSTTFAALQSLSHESDQESFAAIAVPKPNLDFLQATAAYPLVEMWSQIDTKSRRLITEIGIALDRATVLFSTVPSGLTPQPVPIAILRDPTITGSSQRLVLPDPPHHLLFELTVSPVASQAQIVLGIFGLESRTPSAQVTVTLLTAQHQLLRRMDTREDGQVIFTHLAAGHYYLHVRAAGGVWEFGFVLTETVAS